MPCNKTITVAYLDNTTPNRKLQSGYVRGENDDRLSGLKKVTVNGVAIQPIIVDPYNPPLNPLRYKHSLYSGIDVFRALKVFANLKKFDAVIAVGESSALSLILLKTVFRFKTPILVMDPALDYNWKARRHILDIVIPRAENILVRGNNQVNFLKKKYGGKCRATAIFHAINTDFYAPDKSTPGNYIFSIGNDVGRDFQTLIKAAENIEAEVIIKTNEVTISDERLLPNVKILRERVSFEELKSLYAGARLIVMPLHNSVHASGVNSVLESMAMGKATIISDSEGIRDYFQKDITSIVVKPGDAAGLERAIKSIINNDDEISRFGRNARKFVLENFSTPKHNYRIAEVLVQTINQSREKM